MGDQRRASCKNCGRHRNEVGLMSWTGLCGECAIVILNTNAVSIHAKEGTPYLRQQVRQYMAARKVLLDAGLLSS
jgi:hypothetical protein